MKAKKLFAITAAALLLSSFLTAGETSYPLTVTVFDASGKEMRQTVSKRPTRVVTSNVSSTEILLKLGLKDTIIGILKPDNKITNEYAADFASFKVIGDKKSLSKEAVLAARPDIIVGRDKLFNAKALGTVAELNAAGIAAVPQKASVTGINPVLETVLEDVQTYGKIFNAQDKAAELTAQLAARIKETDALVRSKAKGTQKVLAMTNFNGNVFGSFDVSTGLQGNVLARLKLVPALDKPANELGLENLVSMNPDIIFYITADRNAKNDPTAIQNLRTNGALANVTAIKNNAIIAIAYDDFMDYGVRTIEIYSKLAKALYGN